MNCCPEADAKARRAWEGCVAEGRGFRGEVVGRKEDALDRKTSLAQARQANGWGFKRSLEVVRSGSGGAWCWLAKAAPGTIWRETTKFDAGRRGGRDAQPESRWGKRRGEEISVRPKLMMLWSRVRCMGKEQPCKVGSLCWSRETLARKQKIDLGVGPAHNQHGTWLGN